MRLGIVCAATQTMGHASVARALAEGALAEVSGLERLVVFSDQVELLTKLQFFPQEVELLPLGAAMPALDLLLIDAIPFRRTDAVEVLRRSFATPRPRVVVGHCGWVIADPKGSADEWAALLQALGAANVLLYHSEDVCEGKCHVASVSGQLPPPVIHSGLLLPKIAIKPAPRANTFMVLAGGGGGNTAAGAYHGAQERVLEIAQQLLARWPTLECDFIAGPYAPERSGSDRLRILRGVTDVAQRLPSYAFSLTLGGYSACCEHIAADVPTRIVPVEHAEQRANAAWAARYLRAVDFEGDDAIRFGSSRMPAPAPFHWRQLLG